ncbi:hypothetical protein PHYSODRAFT_499146, partial [Phytophthora sojae]
QMSTMEQKVQELEAEKERERESSKNIQRFHAGQVRDLRATLAQVQARRATVAPDLATNVRSSVAQNPEVATRPHDSSGVINGNASVTGQRRETADPKNSSEVAASQLRATLAQTSADTSGRIARVKRGHGATETKVTQDVKLEPVSLGKTSDPRKTATSKASQDSKTDSKRSAPKKHQQQQKKKRQDVNPPSDSDPSSDSSDDDSSSESSDDSSDGNPGVNLTTASTAQAGTTLLTFRPYINSNTLGEFDTKASLRERVHWWEHFANMAAQRGWSTKMRIQELKLKVSGAARDWFNQLSKHTQRDWKELASAFRKKYCKARGGDPVRAGLKKAPELCVLVYVGPELRTRTQDNQQCMTTLTQDFMTSPENQHPEQANAGSVNSEGIVEYKLNPGERYGWWENNDPDPKKRDVAMVHGAVNDCRTRVLLDTGATVNIVSFDLARKLGLTLKSHKQTKV